MHSASGLARIADSLSSQMVRQLFSAMYPEQACLPMAPAFVQIVNQQMARTRKPAHRETIIVEPAYEEPMYQAAVA